MRKRWKNPTWLSNSQADGIGNEDIIEDVGFHTFILQGEVAADPDDEDITVGETFWRLSEVLYFDWHICFVRKVPEGCLVNPFGECKDIKPGEVKREIKKFFF